MGPEQRPFRFGVMIDTRRATLADTLELARRAEASGVSIVLGTDHLGRLAALPLLQAVAQATSLRIGTFVLNNDFRHPALLAQELATLDTVSAGRMEIGIGAGWERAEYEAAGMPFDEPAVRLTRMEASIRLLKQALSEGRMQHLGDASYPQIRMDGLPRSVQRPHPPILVGGGGKRLLGFAAREADIVALNPRSLPGGGLDSNDVTEAATDRKVDWVRQAAGSRWAELELNAVVFEVDPEFRRRSGPPPPRRHGIDEEELPRSPHYLAGDVEAMAEQLLARRERWGISYSAVRGADLDSAALVFRRLAGT